MVLMERAALALVRAVENRFPLLASSPGVIVAGPGNNGGDALAAGRILLEKGAKFHSPGSPRLEFPNRNALRDEAGRTLG